MQPAVAAAAAFKSVVPGWSPATSALNKDTPDYIDTQTSSVHYLQSPWERFLRWLDRVFLWIETNLSQLWNAK
jgi:hypothetical protein